MTRNCVFRWSALPDDVGKSWDSSIVVAYDRRFELESYDGEIIVLLLSGEVRRMRRAELASILKSQPIDTSDPPMTSPQ
jgi:hypothetical protein